MRETSAFESDRNPRQSILRGYNLTGVRAHNERLVLTLVRRRGALSKAEIARMTGLSAQTVSVIVRALEADGLLAKGEPVRGKVGQPSVPIELSANGAYFVGAKIGRRSSELVLTNFLGDVLSRTQLVYRYPTPAEILRFVSASIDKLVGKLSPDEAQRIAGLGVAMPFEIWEWARFIGLPEDAMAAWRETDIRAAIEEFCPYPVYLQNDASAACGAELVFGSGHRPADFLYFYVGYFIGGGVVLDGTLYTGRTGNAGSLGSMPVPAPDGRIAQLIEIASLSGLEASINAHSPNEQSLWIAPDGWSVGHEVLDAWTEKAAQGLAYSIAAAASVIDFEAVLIDGWLSPGLRAALVRETAKHLARINLAGVSPPRILEGTVGPDARALGAASLPLSERFLVNAARGIIED